MTKVPPHPGAADSRTATRYSTQRRQDTAPEHALRRALFAAGKRYRVGLKVPGRARRTMDIAFPGQKVAVFVDGCFWHACPDHGNQPKSNPEWWRVKLSANVARDRDTDQVLREAGWTVIRVWEHEVPDPAVDRVLALLS